MQAIDDFPTYGFNALDAEQQMARFVLLDNPESYPFDHYHAHEYNELLVFIKGGGVHSINFKEHPIRDRSIHLLPAGGLHWVERGMQSKGFAIVYKDQFLYKLQAYHSGIDFSETFSHSEVLNLDEENEHLDLLFSEIINNQDNGVYMLSLIGALLTRIALTFFPDPAARSPKIPIDQTIAELITLINKHFQEHLSAAAYAEKLHVSLSTLERRTKAATGKSVTALQQERLFREAKKLLYYPDTNIQETAWNLGFRESAHFSNWFKKKTGISPLQFRQQ